MAGIKYLNTDNSAPSNHPLVSIILPAFNADSTIKETIESILCQTFIDFELIIIDDGSTDNTFRVIKEFHDQRIKYHYQQNQERAVARNNGITYARGKYIAFIDADDLWLREKLEKQLALLESNPYLGLVYCDLYYFEDISGKIIFLFSDIVKLFRGNIPLFQMIKKCIIQSPTPIVRRSVFDEVGFFDPALVPVEDWDMWLRIVSGYPIDFIDEPLARYRVHQNSTFANPSIGLFDSTLKLLDKVALFINKKDLVSRRRIVTKRSSILIERSLVMFKDGNYADALENILSAIRNLGFYPLANFGRNH